MKGIRMTTDQRFFPPQIDMLWLNQQMFERYPGHATTTISKDLIEKLTQEYIKFWRLVLSFPKLRVVAPGPILAVQRVHFDDRKRYFDDCMDYFNQFMHRELYWLGRHDVIGTVETVRAYISLYEETPPDPWNDIVSEYNLGRNHLSIAT